MHPLRLGYPTGWKSSNVLFRSVPAAGPFLLGKRWSKRCTGRPRSKNIRVLPTVTFEAAVLASHDWLLVLVKPRPLRNESPPDHPGAGH